MKYLKIIKNQILNITFYFIIIIILLNLFCYTTYSKNIELNGLEIDLNIEVVKKSPTYGSSTKEISEFVEKDENKKEIDDSVKIELSIKNKNSYESANVTIEEINPSGFRQNGTNKNEKKIEVKINHKSEKKYNYIYKYHKSYLKDQNGNIVYDDLGNIIDDSIIKKSLEINEKENNISYESKKTKKGIIDVFKFLIIVAIVLFVLFLFTGFYKNVKKEDDFFDRKNPFLIFIIFLFLSLIFNVILNKITFAKTYEPQIYEYGKTYEKVIFESAIFNDKVFRFAYKISFFYDSEYEINELDYENDTDLDGLVDYLEYQYMTDKFNIDTDGDGLNDYIEVLLLDYNPLSKDTFNDGINDGDRDFDNDKLKNLEEIKYGTDLFNVDTDYDTLTDYDEIMKYNTNPIETDTDEDFISDGDELKLGLNPNKNKTDGVTLDSERLIKQNFDMTRVPDKLREGNIFIKNIEGDVNGVIDDKIIIKEYINANLENSNAVVGCLFNIHNIDENILNITFDATKVSDRCEFLIVCKYEDNKLMPLKTDCNSDNLLNCKLTKGIYCIVDTELIIRELNIYNKKYVD